MIALNDKTVPSVTVGSEVTARQRENTKRAEENLLVRILNLYGRLLASSFSSLTLDGRQKTERDDQESERHPRKEEERCGKTS